MQVLKNSSNNLSSKNNVVRVKFVESNIGLRIQKVEYQYYEIAKNILHKNCYTYEWLDIGMFAKYKRKMICSDIQKYKKLQEKNY